ncbi:PREDICTED: tetraspanin-10 [Chrysochloris asiatica]|uniref:Tetraspanin-10 n=1 Tax=Chrysochloris asiatica TaxID=185453 RepID=A0A9B0TTC1_CHRAS|nr:PREDICTED: tetraspanin-10 [Chrysochloris asiatica]
MEVEERSPLLVQTFLPVLWWDILGGDATIVNAVGLVPPPSSSSPHTYSQQYPLSQEKHMAKGRSRGGRLRGPLASSLSAGNACSKYLIFLTNFLFSLLGLLGLAVSLWGLVLKGPVGSGWGCNLPTHPMLGLALGGLVVSTVSLVGCLGALCETTCLLRCFSASLLTCLVLEAVGSALVVALWGSLQDSLDHALQVAIIRYQKDQDLCFYLDQVQLRLRCCGAVSYQDWQRNPYFNCSAPGVQACSLPASCCIDPPEDGASVDIQCGSGALHLDEAAAGRVVHLEGCGPRLRWWLHHSAPALGGGAIVLAVVQITEFLLAAQLLSALAVHKGAAESMRRVPGPPPQAISGPQSRGWERELLGQEEV